MKKEDVVVLEGTASRSVAAVATAKNYGGKGGRKRERADLDNVVKEECPQSLLLKILGPVRKLGHGTALRSYFGREQATEGVTSEEDDGGVISLQDGFWDRAKPFYLAVL
ncbi:unnamed protein product, partial [Amoebophrya sp. A25]|eukprot:GSA25T00013548001.1